MTRTKETPGSRAARLAAFLAGIAVLAALVLAMPRTAHAAESGYCGGAVLGPHQTCYGSARTFNAEHGTGNQGSVCVGSGYGVACSSGAGQGVYKAVGQWIYAEPWIESNRLSGSNTVYGTAFTP